MHTPRALTIAGSDSGGGAGIQADIKTFQELGVFGMTALTAVTAQNTRDVTGIYELPEEAVARQIDAVAEDIGVDAAKTGMIASVSIMEVVAAKVKEHRIHGLVIDPVMIAKSGVPLLEEPARKALQEILLPLARIITPNLHEAEAIVGRELDTEEKRKDAARHMADLGAEAVIIKGGHVEDDQATDLLFDGSRFYTFTAPRFHTPHTHGTGCTFSAALTASLAKGKPLLETVETAKQFITEAIQHPLHIGGGHGPTNHWAYRSSRT
ncbi:bifunctional hydroxymethylpyrimidine kinase/phosphomethylpyrimidine kinase [Paludifilum halophilum]|uniref:Hydroxymethylpyrimidine/phosphomethylpyrimidine kinase n=1 Tax=Paludifilum halophilum TaxID=1642702 RepID=A0A235B7T6_9BACL|nr:bifunctional hydroxymethylpyrimidine kinase/phosphomethylpyrimidine kinase [Paludifilum halophilum]OYD08356.1 bifunctional hydroxymethylpyrimidine kinase/phosphomethylpyrimidine kinase [Paludifilum halophilum]